MMHTLEGLRKGYTTKDPAKGKSKGKSKGKKGCSGGSVKSTAAKKAAPAKESVFEGELTPGPGGKKRMRIDDDEDDEEQSPVKQGSPKEEKVKLEAGLYPS